MRTLWIVLISAFFTAFSSCQLSKETSGDFNLLPIPRVAEFTGSSTLFPDSITFYRLADDIPLPVPLEYVKDLEQTVKLSETQIVFRKEKSIEMAKEGYMLDISKDNITISGSKRTRSSALEYSGGLTSLPFPPWWVTMSMQGGRR